MVFIMDLKSDIAALPREAQSELFREAVYQNNVPAVAAIMAAAPLEREELSAALYDAATHNKLGIGAQLLQSLQIDVNWRNKNVSFYTPLIRAALNGHDAFVDFLLARKDLDLNATTYPNGHYSAAVAMSPYRYSHTSAGITARKIFSDPRHDEAAYQAHLCALAQQRTIDDSHAARRAASYESVEVRVAPVRRALGIKPREYAC